MWHTLYRNSVILLFSASSFLFAGAAIAQLQTVESEVKFITQIVDQLAFGAQVLQLDDPASAQEELPGLGHKFQLFGVMMKDTDPENAVGKPGAAGGGVGGNEGISATMTPADVALAFRSTPPGIKITALRNQLGLKYYFTAERTCGGGSPRVSLLVDSNGDGTFDFVAQGHVNPPLFTACAQNIWTYEDLTDKLKRWEITPLTLGCGPIGAATTCTWDELEMRIMTAFPNHKILAGFLVEDSCSFFPLACGKAHYDLVTIENRTLEIWQDAVQKNH